MMHLKNRGDRIRLTATLCSVCLLAGTIVVPLAVPNSGNAQFTPPLSAEQTKALAAVKRLHQQAEQLYKQGNVSEAISLAEKALEIHQQILGKTHYSVAASLSNLALLYQAQSRFEKAEALFQRALALREQHFGKNHSAVAQIFDHLAKLYEIQGRYTEAERLFQRVRSILESENHPDVAQSLSNLAELYQSQGRYAEAEPLFQRTLAIREQQLGKTHPLVAASLDNLAGFYKNQGRYAEAESLYQRALVIREQKFGKNHFVVAASLNHLALLYQAQGRNGEAEPLYQQALALWEQQFGKTHPSVVLPLNNLAAFYRTQGRNSEAESLYQRALMILERQSFKNSTEIVTSLNGLAALYQVEKRYRDAEPLYQRALAIQEKRLGKNHPDIAARLNNLAGLYMRQGRYPEAEPLLQRSLAILEQRGKNHPSVAISINNLAGFYDAQGRYQEAEPLHQRSLTIYKQYLDENHPIIAHTLNNLAVSYQDQGKTKQVITILSQSLQIEENNLDSNLLLGNEVQKQGYLANLISTTNFAITLHLQAAPTNLEATRLALTTLLRRKGRILEALTDNLQRLRQNLTPADQQKLNQLAAVRTQLAALYYSSLGNYTPEQYRAQITTLQKQANQLETELNNRSAAFRTETQPITIEAARKQIPADAALVELIRYEPLKPKAKPADRFGKPRYAAYILSPQGTIQSVDLGEADAIDLQAEAFRQALRSRDSRVNAISRKLDAILMQPIRAKLGNTRNLLISPDSQLNLIPFAALVDENDRYLVETYSINYLTSGRDLLRLQNTAASRQPPVLIANPDYANPGNPQPIAQSQPRKSTTVVASNSPRPRLGEGQGVRAANRRSTDLAQLRFNPLPGTLAEATAIAPKLKDALVLMGTQATENALKQVQSPRILHIATHGFFLADQAPSIPASRGPSLAPAMTDAYFERFRPRATGNTENALLRSGLALAGFNLRQSGSEDGVLTAQEAAGLDLRGTQLVVLSACETGVGNVANGEGVYGLRRAFVLAGAESQLTSLWQVSDAGTKDLMVKYYDRLLAGVGRGDALRQTQLEFLKDARYQHPFYWAAFIPSGDWRPLK